MRILGQFILWGSLVVGVLAAATAYLVSLDAADEQLLELTLANPAGKVEQPDGTSKPIAEKDESVSSELLRRLRDAGVRNIRVKEFSFRRWRGRWFFLLALIGLVIGSLLTRFAARPKRAAESEAGPADSPQHTLEAIQGTIEQLRRQLSEIPERSARLDLIVEQIGELQKTQMVAFVDARPALVSRIGLGGYAALMDSYAAAERQINRAWSAAADEAYEEATACLDEASTLIEDSRRKHRSFDQDAA